MTDKIFEEYIKLIEFLTGMMPPVSHRNHIRREIEKELKSRYLSGKEFLLLAGNAGDAQQALLNAATINETYFFREEKQFLLLQEEILPELFTNKQKLLIWSVSCSTGEEAVSLAVLAMSEKEKHAARDFHIFATDINTHVLASLESGRFSSHSFRKDGLGFRPLLDKHLMPSGKTGSEFLPDSLLPGKITSRRLNFYQDSFDFLPEPADLIFFRNTLLYLAMDKRDDLISRLADKLASGGYFFLASSEVPFVKNENLILHEKQGVYYFQKQQPANPSPAVPEVEKIQSNKLPKKSSVSPEDMIITCLAAPESLSEGIDAFYTGAARHIRLFLSKINESDFKAADEILTDLKKDIAGTALIAFLEGRLKYWTGEKNTAEEYFLRAFSIRSDFWPARFYYALNLTEKNPVKARDEFRNCLDILENETSGEKNVFSFLLEDFDQAYFKYMCRKWIEKIKPLHRVKI